jgi:hypothetical protein
LINVAIAMKPATGMYLVRMKGKQGNETRKVIIKEALGLSVSSTRFFDLLLSE